MWQAFINENFFLSSIWQNSNALDLHTDASGTLDYGGYLAPGDSEANRNNIRS